MSSPGPAFTSVATGLFRVGDPSAIQPAYLYFLQAAAGPGPVSFEDSWSGNFPGWYIFLPEVLSTADAAGFAGQALHTLPAPGQPRQEGGGTTPAAPATAGPTPRSLVWLRSHKASPWDYALLALGRNPPMHSTRPVSGQTVFDFPPLQLLVGQPNQLTLAVDVDLAGEAFTLTSAAGSDLTFVQLVWMQSSLPTYGYYADHWSLAVPFTGGFAGSIPFDLGLNPGSLAEHLVGGFCYAYPAGQETGVLRYPLFAPPWAASPPPEGTTQYLGFHVRLHPLHPTDPAVSRLTFDQTSQKVGPAGWWNLGTDLQSSFFFLTTGEPTAVRPSLPEASPPDADAPGFVLAVNGADALGSPLHYLAPAGPFEFVGASPEAPLPVMPAFSAQEYLLVHPGDRFELVPGQPAYAPGFSPGGTGQAAAGAALTDTCTTSWMSYGAPLAQAGRAFFGQPAKSTYFAPAAATRFPVAVESFLSGLETPAVFPLVPYGGVFGTSQGQGGSAGFTAFELAVLTPSRHAALTAGGAGPSFRVPGYAAAPRAPGPGAMPAGTAPADAAAPATATTPQGLLVELNPDGSWHRLLLARGPVDPSQLLAFGPAAGSPEGVLDDRLTNALSQNGLFLVISSPAHVGDFGVADQVDIGGFNLLLDLDEGAILVFKFNPCSSLADLVANASLWTATDDFVGTPAAVAAVQAQLQESLRVAGVGGGAPASPDTGDTGGPFAYFRQIAVDPAWTGVLCFDGVVDGHGMPPDFQMLLGGVQGPLRAHHLGIEVNHVGGGSPGAGELTNSSLFGVIHYQAPPPGGSPAAASPAGDGDFAYAVEYLTVVFGNSVITQFNAEVGLTVRRLFGREVALQGVPPSSPPVPANTLTIKGQYQKAGASSGSAGVGTVSFVADQPFVYAAVTPPGGSRVIEKVVFTGATLAPVSGGGGSPDAPVRAAFTLSGEIWFAAAPFPGAPELDLFSYGNPAAAGRGPGSPGGAGLAFSGLTVLISFLMDAEGSMLPGSETVAGDLSGLVIAPTAQAIRDESLLGSLPLKPNALRYAPAGLTAAALNAAPVHVAQLEGSGTQPAGSPAGTGNPAPSPYTTSSPQYALVYDFPLGTLGAMAGPHAGLNASLYLAWGPSSVVRDNDAAAILVQLPSLSAGYSGFNLQGMIKTVFGDANLFRVDTHAGAVYGILFNNVALSLLGYDFPPGVVVDFVVFAGTPEEGAPRNASNLAWYLAATAPASSSP
ncbi:MAG TPA: hypothetical protein VGB24_18570 [Longimicrobium sp.]|uniref:hypothetical protein n=1 Tax=Longimicrobium sp. TaxID=2029185 RepID=UPI002EDACEC1